MISNDDFFDWKKPDYAPILERRAEALIRIRENPSCLPDLRMYYAEHPWDFITDWGMTFDTRLAERRLPTKIPMVLFPKQIEFMRWVFERWLKQEDGLCEKSRDMGISWCSIEFACTLCIFHTGVSFGFGSRLAEYVDKIGDMKALLPKGRFFMANLPVEFTGGYVPWRDAPHMQINFPETGSSVNGEGGDDIGRGDRKAIYFLDEHAHFPRPHIAEAALSQTTNCRIYMSSVRGSNNLFAQKRFSGKIPVFIFDWHDDPRKDDAWYAKQCEKFDAIVVAQEIDRDYGASVAGIVIPAEWVRACVNSCEKLGINPTGAKRGALDVADEGPDKNAFCGAHGVQVEHLAEWSGKGSDIFVTAERAVNFADEFGYRGFRYDADGLGAGIRGDMRVINEKRVSLGAKAHIVEGWRASGAVHEPDGVVEGTKGIDNGDTGRLNKDYFKNAKSQGWWSLRRRAQKTFLWVAKGIPCDPDDILSISTEATGWEKLVVELSQPTYKQDDLGKIVINKKPDNMPSPNYADAVMMCFAPGGEPVIMVTRQLLTLASQLPKRRRH